MSIALNPQFETLFLLQGEDPKENREQTIQELNNLGMDGDAFYVKYFPLVERYYEAFAKHKKASEGTKLLGGSDTYLISAYIEVFWQNPHWLDGMDCVPEEEIQAALDQSLQSDASAYIDTLESMGLSDRSKWLAMLLVQRPRQQLSLIANAVRENLPAFEKAQAAVKKPLGELLNEFAAAMENPDKTRLMKISNGIMPDAPVLPTLAQPLMMLAIEDVVFYGLLVDKISGAGSEPSRTDLQMGAKALGDKSKLEILLCLKNKRLYNLEIAEKVGLTPATVSHHMNILLATGFVTLGKQDGKVYYTLNTSGIERFLQGMGQLLVYDAD